MRELITLLMPVLTLSCVAAATRASPPTWCFAERHRGSSAPVTDVDVAPVTAAHMGAAVARLRNRSVIELSSVEADRYAQAISNAPGVRHYLVRANVTTRPGADWNEIRDLAAESGTFELHWSRDTNSVLVLNFQTVEGPRKDNNVALVLSTSLPIQHAYVGCYVTD